MAETSGAVVLWANERPDFATAIEQLYQVRYTGAVTIHFRNGVAQELELPRPATKLKLMTGK